MWAGPEGELKDLETMVRAMASGDAAAVAALARELGYARTEAEVRRWIMRAHDASGLRAGFVACQGETVVGWVEVSLVEHVQTEPHGLIGGLVVREEVRGVGIGRMLRERAEAWVWGHGVEEVVVTSRSTRTAAHRFYVRDGYERVKTSEVFRKARPR